MSKKDKILVPKIIHYCWFGGKPLSSLAKKCIESWKKYCPDYEIKEWNENNFNLNLNKYMKQAYENKKWAFVTDYVRLKVLYDFGGIYMDTDVEVVKPLDEFLSLSAFSGFEGYDRIPTGIMGAAKGNKWIEELLKDYNNRSFIMEDGSFDLTTNVKTITDTTKRLYPIVLNNTLQQFEDVTFYPFDWFCAKKLSDGSINISDDTHTIHHFAGSWTTPKKKLIKKLMNIFGSKFILKLVLIKHKLQGR